MTGCPYNSGLEPRVVEELLSLQKTTRSPNLLGELAALYLELLEPRLSALHLAKAEGHTQEWQHILHKLAGSSGSIGAHRLMWLSQCLHMEEDERVYQQFLEEAEVVRQALREWIPPQS